MVTWFALFCGTVYNIIQSCFFLIFTVDDKLTKYHLGINNSKTFSEVIVSFCFVFSIVTPPPHFALNRNQFGRIWLSQRGLVVLCLWMLFPWHSCPPHTTALKKSTATLGNKASLAGLGLHYLRSSVVIVIFRCLRPLGKGEAIVRTRGGSHAGRDVERARCSGDTFHSFWISCFLC